MALFVLVFTMTAGLLVAAGLDLKMRMTRQQAAVLQLDALLDGGTAHGLAELDRSRLYQGTVGPVPLGPGKYQVVTRQEGSEIDLFVAAHLGGARRQIRARVALYPTRVLSWRREAFDPELWRP